MQSLIIHMSRAITIILSVVLLVMVSWIGWNSLNSMCFLGPDIDSGMYSALGLHVLHGYVPYRDIWEQKPPMIFFIEAFALWITDHSVGGIRDLERVCGCLRGALFFLIVRKAFGSEWLAAMSTSVFLAYFYSPGVFQGGNLTEEYATVFVLCGIYASQYARGLIGRRSMMASALAGFWFSLAALTKEPFLFSFIPWVAFIALKRQGGWRGGVLRTAFFVVGGLLPLLGCVAYLAWHRSLEYWFDAISFSVNYAAAGTTGIGSRQKLVHNWRYFSEFVLNNSSAVTIAAYVGIIGSLGTLFIRERNFFIPAVFASLALDYYASSLSGRAYGHYYMQTIPSFILMATCGFGFIGSSLGRGKPYVGIGVLALGIFSAYQKDSAFFSTWYRGVVAPYHRYEQQDPIVRYIRQNSAPTDRIWQSSIRTIRRYIETDRLSPIKFVYIDEVLRVDTGLSSGEEKIIGIKEGLRMNPPKFIIISTEEADHFGLSDWLKSNYLDTGVVDGNMRLFNRVSS